MPKVCRTSYNMAFKFKVVAEAEAAKRTSGCFTPKYPELDQQMLVRNGFQTKESKVSIHCFMPNRRLFKTLGYKPNAPFWKKILKTE